MIERESENCSVTCEIILSQPGRSSVPGGVRMTEVTRRHSVYLQLYYTDVLQRPRLSRVF